MKVRLRLARTLVASTVTLAGSGALVALPAQRVVQAPRIMVPVFRSSEKGLGEQAANAVRSKLEGDVSPRQLVVIPKKDIDTTLVLSGYSTTEALNSNDAKALANQIRADEYVEGFASRTPTGYKIDARLVLSRDQNVAQPLPSASAAKLDDAAAAISRSLRDARKQIDAEKECYFSSRLSKYDEAIKSANKSIASYAQSTMGRLCLMGVYQSRHAPGDTALMLKTAEEVLAIDPFSRPALTIVSPLYLAKGDTNKYVGSLGQMVAADPQNATLVNRVVNDLGAIGRAKDAIPAVETALSANPGDPSLTRTAWLLYLASSDFKKALSVGEELIKLDTAAFDTTFAVRMAGAATADSQPQKALEWLSRGATRFPNNAQLWLVRGQQERKLGQTQQAVTSLQKALSLNPAIENGNLLLAQTFIDLKMPDSAVAYIHNAAAAPNANKALVAGFTLTIGNNLYKDASALKAKADSNDASVKGEDVRNAFKKAISVLAYSDSLGESTMNAALLAGVSAFYAGASAATDAPKTKSCELAREAQADFTMVNLYVPRAGRSNPQTAGQIMSAVGQYAPVIENQVKTFCKTAGKGAGKGT